MQLQPGTVLGHYEVIAPLGAGGMGEVYRARDTKLGREVAIKVLPGAFTQDAERLARFEREARLLAALDHPHVASIYGFEDLDGVRFLVMQLAEGEDLSQRLSRGPIPVDEAVGIAKQMAGALEAAHEQGIVHRDLKPANIKVAGDGRVKILDFGLAKALESDEADEDFSNSPTMIRAATHAGIILGTAAYMSPEQARGRRVDKRADIWAFGVVLWEMLTGRRLFGGDTVSDTLAAVLTREPDLSDLPAGTPRMLQWVLQRCLERDPTRRLHDIADARIVLDDLPGPGDAEASGPDRDARPVVSTRVHLAWLMALVGACVVTVWLARSGGAPGAGSGDPAHLAIHLAANQQLTTRGNSTLAFSPDGETLVFPGAEDGRVSLFRRRLGDPVATAIPGTADGQAPFFSPDGAWIGFTAGGRLQKVAVDGGRPFELAAIQGSGGATWLGDETIVYAPVYSDGLFRVSADGGTPERLTTPDRAAGELGHWWPDPLPGEAQVLFTAFRTPVDESRIGVVDLDTREITWLVDGGFFGRWVPTGHLVYARGQRVFAMPFDPATLSATGPAVAVLDDVRVAETGGYAMAAVSSRGTLAYATESLASPLGELVWLDRAGNASPAMEERLRLISASLSPDQRQAAISIKGDSRDLWIYSFDRGTLSRMTTGADTEFDPVWSADSQELFYVVDSPPFELHRIRAGSPDSGRPIWDEPAELDMTGIAVSPDGRTLAFTVAEPDTGDNIYTRPIDGSEPRRPFRATRAAEDWPAFSPDGRWIAYESDESGRPEIYVDPFPGPGDHVQITSDGGTSPIWSKNGELFFRRADDTWSVATRTGDRFEFDTPTRLHTYPIVPNIDEGRAYDVTADGRRLLAVTIPDADRPRQIEVVTGWMAGLVRLAPPRR